MTAVLILSLVCSVGTEKNGFTRWNGFPTLKSSVPARFLKEAFVRISPSGDIRGRCSGYKTPRLVSKGYTVCNVVVASSVLYSVSENATMRGYTVKVTTDGVGATINIPDVVVTVAVTVASERKAEQKVLAEAECSESVDITFVTDD